LAIRTAAPQPPASAPPSPLPYLAPPVTFSRLAQDTRDLHAAASAGRLSAHPAIDQAGYRPRTLSVLLDDPAAAALSLRIHMEPTDLMELILILAEATADVLRQRKEAESPDSGQRHGTPQEKEVFEVPAPTHANDETIGPMTNAYRLCRDGPSLGARLPVEVTTGTEGAVDRILPRSDTSGVGVEVCPVGYRAPQFRANPALRDTRNRPGWPSTCIYRP